MQSSQFKLRNPALLAGAIMILLLASPMDAMAKKCPYPGHPSCSDNDGGGDFTNTAQDTYAWWTGNLESDSRECTTGFISVNQEYSSNGCDTSAASPTVAILFGSTDYVASGRKPEICDILSEGVVFGDDTDGATNRITDFAFSVSKEWNGTACLDDGLGTTECRIRVLNTAYGELCTDAERASGDCGERLIVMTGFGFADAAPPPEVNPFTQDQEIDLNELTFAIKAVGKNRTEATCTVIFSPAAVTFHTLTR